MSRPFDLAELLLMLAFLGALATVALLRLDEREYERAVAADCSSDSECVDKHCPPPNDDPDCAEAVLDDGDSAAARAMARAMERRSAK